MLSAVRLSHRVAAGVDSPMAAAYDAVATAAGRRPLLDLARAAPSYPPAPEVVEHAADVAADARYAAQAGLPHLREAFAEALRAEHGGDVDAGDMVVTAGCNQAFCLAADALCAPGDEVITPRPTYFNHTMWLRMRGVEPVIVEPDADLVPRASDAEALVSPRTRAIVLVTPGNPSGVEIPADELAAFADVARRHDLALVLDETYRAFRAGPAHTLYAAPDWRDTVVGLHSFSKDLALAGYRVGMLVAGGALRRQALKLLDCVAIGAPRIGQEAAWAGLVKAQGWRAERAAEVAARRAAFAEAMRARPGGFEVVALGGFFAWVRHPRPTMPTPAVVQALLTEQDVLVMSGTDFQAVDDGAMRVSVGNLTDVDDLVTRLREFGA